MQTIRNIFESVINLFYPGLCILCRRLLISEERFMCINCLCDLPYTDYHINKGNPALALFAGYTQVEEATSLLFFEKEGVTQSLIHAFKYHGNKGLAESLGMMAARILKDYGFFASIDAIIPVPLHPKKEKKRGYNQSEYIARGFASVYNIPIDKTLLERIIYTDSQTKKTIYDRHVNVENIFSVVTPEQLFGRHILLIDDVITTGATVSACIEAFADISDLKISVFSLAITRTY